MPGALRLTWVWGTHSCQAWGDRPRPPPQPLLLPAAELSWVEVVTPESGSSLHQVLCPQGGHHCPQAKEALGQ